MTTSYGQALMSSNGYSGIGLVPAASTLQQGVSVFAVDKNLPGARNTSGTTSQLGFGLERNLELVGKLASNDSSCNMFQTGACPPNAIRDFSASLKWSTAADWLERYRAIAAVGVTDVGGAATNFRSYYAVVSKDIADSLALRLGAAQAKSETAYLRGGMASVDWSPYPWMQTSLQRVGQVDTAHVGVFTRIPGTAYSGYLTFNQRLSEQLGQWQSSERRWFSLGVNVPLETVKKNAELKDAAADHDSSRTVIESREEELLGLLERNGFYRVRTGTKNGDVKLIEVENTAYAWNAVDAAGVALGAVASVWGGQPQPFELRINTRGLKHLVLKGDAQCVRRWFSGQAFCEGLELQSALNSAGLNEESGVDWDGLARGSWQFRPELQISPVITSTIGTEYGSYDADVGANINMVLPLWKGATLDINRVEPLGLKTKNFEENGVYYPSRIQAATSRRMVHQIFDFSSWSTQARISAGKVNTLWDGLQLETQTQSLDGRHRLGWTAGKFDNVQYGSRYKREYDLLQYRYSWNDAQTTSTEITAGKYWGGDKGYTLAQRFWFGDTSLLMYLRRTRMNELGSTVSFAGVTLSIPLTPRRNVGYRHFMLRGTPQWSYAVESKVMDKDNRITAGYGQLPSTGELLATTFNRDRNSTPYFNANLWRVKDAYVRLYME